MDTNYLTSAFACIAADTIWEFAIKPYVITPWLDRHNCEGIPSAPTKRTPAYREQLKNAQATIIRYHL